MRSLFSWENKRVKVGGGVARPKKYNIKAMIETLEEYTENTDIPILKEVCYLNHWNYVYINELAKKEENQTLSESIKRLLDKKEFQLERLGLNGSIEKTMAIFSLKQLGWKDKPDISGDGITKEEDALSKALREAVQSE